ncbi:MAG TPA: hypothetical protein VF691_15620 [Cytophagaceae bacterium]
MTNTSRSLIENQIAESRNSMIISLLILGAVITLMSIVTFVTSLFTLGLYKFDFNKADSFSYYEQLKGESTHFGGKATLIVSVFKGIVQRAKSV